jgi:hypothetical protein
VKTCAGSSGIGAWAGARSLSIDSSRVFSFGVGTFGVAGLTEGGWLGRVDSAIGDANGETPLVIGPQVSLSVSPSLLVALMVLDTGGAPRSVKPLGILSRSLPLSLEVNGGSMARSLPLRLRPLTSTSAAGAEDENDRPLDPVRSRSNPLAVSMLGMLGILGVLMTDSALGNSTADPNLLLGLPEV